MVMGYWSVAILFWQLSIDHIVNVLKSYIKDVDLPRHAWATPPFLLIVSPTPPVQSVDAYVRTYVRSVNHVTTKWKEVDHIPWVWGSVPRALRARGSPAITYYIYSPLKSTKKKNLVWLKLFCYMVFMVFVHWKLKLLNFLMDSVFIC